MQRKTATLQFLGTGASNGIPVIGCKCHVCISANPRNQRLRTSALIRMDGKNYLIDAGPDIRRQALSYRIDHIEGVIITHTHFDHIGGLEELRIFNFIQNGPIRCSLSQESYEEVQRLFHYHFKEENEDKNFTAKFHFHPLVRHTGTAELNGLKLNYTTYKQGDMSVLGLRIGGLAYLTDVKTFEPSIFQFLEGVQTLVVSALRFTPSRLHLTIDEAIEFAKKVDAKNTYFIHLSHEVEYEHAQSLLPDGVLLAYDGLQIDFEA